MNGLQEKVKQLNSMITESKTLLAIELFYADDVVMQENEEEPRRGKTNCLAAEKAKVSKVSEVHSKLLNQAIDAKAQVVFSEWKITFTNHQKNNIPAH